MPIYLLVLLFVVVVYSALPIIYASGCVPVKTFLPPVEILFVDSFLDDCSLPQG